jgi:hypothetical protein
LWKPNTQSYAEKTGTGDFFLLDLQELRANGPPIYFVQGIYAHELKGSLVKKTKKPHEIKDFAPKK